MKIPKFGGNKKPKDDRPKLTRKAAELCAAVDAFDGRKRMKAQKAIGALMNAVHALGELPEETSDKLLDVLMTFAQQKFMWGKDGDVLFEQLKDGLTPDFLKLIDSSR